MFQTGEKLNLNIYFEMELKNSAIEVENLTFFIDDMPLISS